jgi:hypothetical protein
MMKHDISAGDFIIEKQPDGTYNVLDADWIVRRNAADLTQANRVIIGEIDGGRVWFRDFRDPPGHVEPR